MKEYVSTYKCPTCNGRASGLGHLCHPKRVTTPYRCYFCDKEITDGRHVCPDMVERLEYHCTDCGRLAIYDSLLCKPSLIGGE